MDETGIGPDHPAQIRNEIARTDVVFGIGAVSGRYPAQGGEPDLLEWGGAEVQRYQTP